MMTWTENKKAEEKLNKNHKCGRKCVGVVTKKQKQNKTQQPKNSEQAQATKFTVRVLQKKTGASGRERKRRGRHTSIAYGMYYYA